MYRNGVRAQADQPAMASRRFGVCLAVRKRYLPTESTMDRVRAESSRHGLVSLSGLTSEYLFYATHFVESIYFNFGVAVIRHVSVTSRLQYIP
jgi:hypothetical protein